MDNHHEQVPHTWQRDHIADAGETLDVRALSPGGTWGALVRGMALDRPRAPGGVEYTTPWLPVDPYAERLSGAACMGVSSTIRRNGRMQLSMFRRVGSICTILDNPVAWDGADVSEVVGMSIAVSRVVSCVYSALFSAGCCWSATRPGLVPDSPVEPAVAGYGRDGWSVTLRASETFLWDIRITDEPCPNLCLSTADGTFVHGHMDPVLFFASVCRQAQLLRYRCIAGGASAFMGLLSACLGREVVRHLGAPDRGALACELELVDKFLVAPDAATAGGICTLAGQVASDGVLRAMLPCWRGWVDDRVLEALHRDGPTVYGRHVATTLVAWFVSGGPPGMYAGDPTDLRAGVCLMLGPMKHRLPDLPGSLDDACTSTGLDVGPFLAWCEHGAGIVVGPSGRDWSLSDPVSQALSLDQPPEDCTFAWSDDDILDSPRMGDDACEAEFPELAMGTLGWDNTP